jgi:hypothetical protein
MHNRKNKDELLKEIDYKLNLGYNLVDYFLTIGTNPNVFKNKWLYESDISELNTKYKEELKPIIINKFPTTEKKTVGFDEAIILHCFPNGFEVYESNKQPQYKIFSILLDNNNYSINFPFKYVVCLKFYESINNYKKIDDKLMEYSDISIPKDTDLEENISIHLPTSINKTTTFPKTASKRNEKEEMCDLYYPEPCDGNPESNDNCSNISNKDNHLVKTAQTFDSKNEINDIRSSNTYFSNKTKECKESKECYKYRKYYIPKCICLISLYPYINELSKIIKIIYKYSLVEKQIYPLEKIINNLLIEVPTPPRGIYYIEYSLINESIILKANQMNELHTLNIEFEKLFTIFNLNNIMEIFRYLMLNAKIIIFTEEIRNLTPVILSLLSLLYPFHYPYTVVSVLHKEAYKLIDNIVPVLVGINEKYNKNFLKDNDIDISDFTLIVNMDNQELIKMGESQDRKLPQLPSKYKANLENKINNYILEIKKNKKNKGKGETPKVLQHKMRSFFLEFQIELMKDYSKYLDNDIYKHQDDGKTPLENAFKIKDFLNKVPSEYYNFFEYFSSTQMFCDFIYKRMMPRDKNEQIDILYFEEKLLKSKTDSIFLNSPNYKIIKKFGVPKPTPLSTQESNYFNNYDIRKNLLSNGIEISNRKDRDSFFNRGKSFTITKKCNPNNRNKDNNLNFDEENEDDDDLSIEKRKTMSFHKKDNMNNNGEDISYNNRSQYNQNNQPLFSYFIFPKLDNEFFFQNDLKNYYIDFSIYQEVKNIDNELLSKSHLSRVEIKTNEATNYINLIWLKMWVSTFYYQDKQEQKYRFFQMLNILDKINQHEMGIINNLFIVLVNNHIDEDLLLLLYEKILHYQLIPSNFIFKTIRNLISNKKSKLKLKTFNISKYLKSINNTGLEEIKEARNMKKKFRKRTIRSIYDTQILDEKVTFLVEENCNECDKKINMYDFMSNIKDMNDDLLWAKCPYCGYNYLPKLKVFFGTENNKNNRLLLTTSIVDNVILYSPKTLNYNMFDSAKNNYNINLEDLKSNYNPFFWNIIWYFKVKKLPFDFILPYEDNIVYYLINNKQKKNDTEEKYNKLKNIKNFNIKFSQYIKKQNPKENFKNKKKNWNKKNELIICFDEIDIFIPPKNSNQNFIMNSSTNMSHTSDYKSVINVNDFDIGSQYSLEKSSNCSVSIIDSMKKSFNNNKYNDTNNKITPFTHSSISITKIKPRKNQNFTSIYNSSNNEINSNKRVQLLSNSVKKEQYANSSSSLQKVKYNGIIKVLRNSKVSKNELMDNYMGHSPKNLNGINDIDYYIGSY